MKPLQRPERAIPESRGDPRVMACPAELSTHLASKRSCEPAERRCECGKLMAKLTAAGIEVKCARCRRVVVIAWREVGFERT